SVLNHRFLTRSKRTQRFLKAGFLLNSMAEGCGHFLISKLLLAQNPCISSFITAIILLISLCLIIFLLLEAFISYSPFSLVIYYTHFSYHDLKDKYRNLTFYIH